MSATGMTVAANERAWQLPSRGRVGMICLIIAESAIFMIFVVAYIFYIGKSLSGPTPREVLAVPIVGTICLLSSSPTIHWAIASLRRGQAAAFRIFWFLTLVLGAIFIGSTILEWHHLIYQDNFTIQTNLFGTTYYCLVGLHALHVIVGLIGLALVMILALIGRVKREHSDRCDVFSLYWHFVDAVWVVVFTTVYIVSR
ncbi:MAG TPA: heme-copper oxidase subunit III [Candidatus Acidoferrales bacterium]|nr:heme-copper oxidase subunit III [Candidatus Acidoferrales bacterium]